MAADDRACVVASTGCAPYKRLTMWELKAALAAFLILIFTGVVRLVTPSHWRHAVPHAVIAVAYLVIGITIGVVLTSLDR
jgi:uncharacterized membrane protein AbrB (regulator of aidB expression)